MGVFAMAAPDCRRMTSRRSVVTLPRVPPVRRSQTPLMCIAPASGNSRVTWTIHAASGPPDDPPHPGHDRAAQGDAVSGETAVLTPAEVAPLLRLRESTVREMARDGRLARLAGIRRVLIPRWSVEALIGRPYDDEYGRTRDGWLDETPGRPLPGHPDDARRPARLAPSPVPQRRQAHPARTRGHARSRPRPLIPDARGMAPLLADEPA